MPTGNLAAASPANVLPKTLCTAFSQSGYYPTLQTQYHDGTTESSVIFDGVNLPLRMRSWKFTKRLDVNDVVALRGFWELVEGGLFPFFFYNPWDTQGQPFGSNFDPTGVNTVGRVTCFFRGSWSETTDIGRTNVPLELIEVM